MANDIGTQTGIGGTSMALNGQRGEGAMKPNPKGEHNPGDTKPTREKCVSVPNAMERGGEKK